MVPDLIRRQQAAAATLARHRGKRFDWRTGQTCVHMARFHLRAMGHRPEKLPRIASLIAAQRALAERGWADAAAMIDAQGLPRIAPAAMLAGDLAFRASDEGDGTGVGGLLICMGAHKLFGWFDNEETGGRAVVMDMDFDQVEACWRG